MTSNRAFRRLGVTLCSLCLLTSTAIAQERVYTNADLGKPIAGKVTVTPEQLAALKAREFHLAPKYDGPIVIVIPRVVSRTSPGFRCSRRRGRSRRRATTI